MRLIDARMEKWAIEAAEPVTFRLGHPALSRGD
jgi:hypothetical protein